VGIGNSLNGRLIWVSSCFHTTLILNIFLCTDMFSILCTTKLLDPQLVLDDPILLLDPK
jgi:hypothetical protein